MLLKGGAYDEIETPTNLNKLGDFINPNADESKRAGFILAVA